jgi:diguanylate cyclase (GGDEF)-like protein/PAS domain S-box-containing protein
MYSVTDLEWLDKRYKYVLENITDVMWELDSRLVFTFISSQDKEQRGYYPSDVVGRPLFAFLAGASQQTVVNAIAALARTAREGQHAPLVLQDVQQISRSGGIVLTEMTISPVIEIGVLTGFVGSTRVLREQKSRTDDVVNEYLNRIEQLSKTVDRLSVIDKLTGAFNREKFESIWDQEVARDRRYKINLSLVIVNVDHFKTLNEKHGHVRGDNALVELMRVISRFTRDTDSVFRWGSDEFVLLLPHTTKEQAGIQAERLRQAVEQGQFSLGEKISISAGVTEYIDGETADSTVVRADKALYIAKRSGHNQVAVR